MSIMLPTVLEHQMTFFTADVLLQYTYNIIIYFIYCNYNMTIISILYIMYIISCAHVYTMYMFMWIHTVKVFAFMSLNLCGAEQCITKV